MYVIVSSVHFIVCLMLVIRYACLNKKYKDSLKVFSISVITYTIFSNMCSIAEVLIYFAIKNYYTTHKQIFYCSFSFLHLLIIIFLWWITSFRIVLNEANFLVYNPLFFRVKYEYSDILSYENNKKTGDIIIKTSKRKIKVPLYIENQTKILKYIEAK